MKSAVLKLKSIIRIELKLCPKDPHEPIHHARVEINGVVFEGVFLKTLNNKVQRDTILLRKVPGLMRQLSKDETALEKVKAFNRWSQKMQKQWGLGKTGTLKKIERFATANSTPREFNLRTVAYHYGAVPVLPIGEIEKNKRTYYVSVLPVLLDVPARNPEDDKREILLSYDRHLPHLLEAYYEQVGYYLKAIFFGADEEHIIKYAHRIRSILVGSIRKKVSEIQGERLGKNQPLANDIRAGWKREIQIAEAVDAFGHLITNYLYSFFCIKSDTGKYEERLSNIVSTEDVMEAEDPVTFLRECVMHISRSKNNDVFVSNISKLKTKWLVSFAEAAAFIGEIKRSCKQGFFAPTIFIGYHFDIDGNESAFDQLKLAVKDHWPHVQLLRGRHLARNIRWSLLSRIWIPLVEMIKHYHIQGLLLSGSTLYRGICPFCGEPEFQAMPVHARWLCFACDRMGTTFDLARQLEGVRKKEALTRINTWIRGESVIGSIICL